MKSTLSLAGSEIIQGNNLYNMLQVSTPIKSEQKIITKTYNTINTTHSDRFNKKIKEKNNHNNNIEKKMYESKRINAFDLSKIKYNDGYILTDALNSNPGFGLWAIKGSSEKEKETNQDFQLKTGKFTININTKKDQNNTNNRYNTTNRTSKQLTNNISTISNSNINNVSTSKNLKKNKQIKSLNITHNIINESINSDSNVNSVVNEKHAQNKLLIEQLTLKCNDFEKKYLNIVSSYQEKENLCKDSLKMKNEYEKLLEENIEETKSIQEEYKKISLENSKLTNIYKNTKGELDRLMSVMRTDKNTMDKLREEFENRLKSEENERNRLNNILKINQKEIDRLQKEAFGNYNTETDSQNNNINIGNSINGQKKNNINVKEIVINKNSSQKKDFEIENLDNIILELELKISKLRKKNAQTEEENEKLRHILRYKEQKEEIQKNDMNNLNNLLEKNNKIEKNDLKKINQQNKIIKIWKNNHTFINRNDNKLTKSMSLKKIKLI